MATLDTTPPDDYRTEIIGYVEPWIASPGSTIDVKVSELVNLVLVSPTVSRGRHSYSTADNTDGSHSQSQS